MHTGAITRMPILTNDLRSPDQRRSDQLTILRRRQPPPRSAGRFFKILADTGAAIGAFDPAFDSDAETDGPASGSGIWRRELSRVRSVSSTSIGVLMEEKRVPSFGEKMRNDSEGRLFDRVASRQESDDSLVFEGFVRERASSFYGKDSDDVDEVVGEGMSAVSEKVLREELEEDYDMFYHGKGKENASPNDACESREKEEAGEDGQVRKEQGGSGVPRKKRTNDSARSEESDKVTRSLESGVGSVEEGTQSESLHTLKRIRVNEDADRFTVSIVSDDNSDEELEGVSALVPSPYRCGGVPLFVEEIGRVPRAVIIDGKVTRVRVSPERGSFRDVVSRARRSSFGWGFRRSGWFGRRKSLGGDSGLRRNRKWKWKRLLFRHGSES